MTNNNTKETKFEVLNCLNVEEITIVVIIWFVIQVFGNGMLLGLIQYDKYGNDPLKRRINDQVRFLIFSKNPFNHKFLTAFYKLSSFEHCMQPYICKHAQLVSNYKHGFQLQLELTCPFFKTILHWIWCALYHREHFIQILYRVHSQTCTISR